ncbi:MAG: PilZ domain-containing protein, partial [Burkholderiaceae bacterium]|nr:PilZ domain-containing protein [Burkholderiaceae bacterium]
MPHERRHFVRVDFDAPALLTLADRTRPVRVLDLSLKGALIGLPDPEGVDVGWLGQLSM